MAAPVVARVATVHRAPIRVSGGDVLTPGRVDTDWPAFTCVVRTDGAEGWMPTALLQRATGSPAHAVANADDDTTELEVDPGDRVRLHRPLADGWWAEDDTGTRGWLPARVLAPPAPAGTTD